MEYKTYYIIHILNNILVGRHCPEKSGSSGGSPITMPPPLNMPLIGSVCLSRVLLTDGVVVGVAVGIVPQRVGPVIL